MEEKDAWTDVTNLMYHNGILHVFGILVPKTNDSTWAWHLRLDAATGKELCPGQMPGKP